MGDAARHAQSGLHYPLGGSAQLPVTKIKNGAGCPTPSFLNCLPTDVELEAELHTETKQTQFPGFFQTQAERSF